MTPGPDRKTFARRTAAAVVCAAAFVAAPAVWLARGDDASRADAAPARPATAATPPPAITPTADATRPADPPTVKRGPAAERPRPARPLDQRPVTAEEWSEISQFMSGHMPWRIAEVQRMPEGQLKERIKKLLANRYRGLRAIEGRDPEAYEQRLGQLKIEDHVYKLVAEWSGADSAGRERLRDELRAQVARLVDVDIQERQRRVARLEDELRRQKKVLEQDVRERDAVVERRLGRFLDWGSRWPVRRQRGPDAGGKEAAKAKKPGDARPNGAPPADGADDDAEP